VGGQFESVGRVVMKIDQTHLVQALVHVHWVRANGKLEFNQ
jgi:hypothetical protein